MANIKTAISMNDSLFEKADELAREMNVSRSHLFVLAMEEYLQRHNNIRLIRQIDSAYADAPDSAEQERMRIIRRQHRRIVEGSW